jgi:hypothetical protein
MKRLVTELGLGPGPFVLWELARLMDGYTSGRLS